MSEARKARRKNLHCIVYHGPNTEPPAQKAGIDWRPADELPASGHLGKEAAVLVMDAAMVERAGDMRNLARSVVIVAADEQAEKLLGARAYSSLAGAQDPAGSNRVFRAACKFAVMRTIARRRRRQLALTRLELYELKRISIALSQERSLSALLHEILDQGKRLTESDAGSLFLMEIDENDVPYLYTASFNSDSIPDLPPSDPVRIRLDNTSIIGHAALSGKPVNVADAYDLPPDAGFRQNPFYDEKYGYRRRSMLVVPMIDHHEHLVGVLVFVNRKTKPSAIISTEEDADRYVLRYTGRQLRLARALAAQAAVAIENVRLYKRIETILESFVKASVSAIDERDPGTAGHSIRVAMRALDLAAAVDRESRGAYGDTQFTREELRELKFAALLHDFGKLGVREDVLVKAKKLPPLLWERIDARFDLIRSTMEVEYYKQRANLQAEDAHGLTRLEEKFVEQVEKLDHQRDVVRAANEPTILDKSVAVELIEIAKHTFERPGHDAEPYLTPDEFHYLQIAKGSLDEHERSEIQSHPEQSYRFLNQIPWTEDLKSMPRRSRMTITSD